MLIIAAALAFASGCYGRMHARGTVTVVPRALVEVSPGVWVVEGSESVYYHSGWYWYWDDGIWYRAPRYGDAWVAVGVGFVPRELVRIDQPDQYVRVHAADGVRVRSVPRERVRAAPRIRVEGNLPAVRVESRPRVRGHRRR